jgi:hypothetical protein
MTRMASRPFCKMLNDAFANLQVGESSKPKPTRGIDNEPPMLS